MSIQDWWIYFNEPWQLHGVIKGSFFLVCSKQNLHWDGALLDVLLTDKVLIICKGLVFFGIKVNWVLLWEIFVFDNEVFTESI